MLMVDIRDCLAGAHVGEKNAISSRELEKRVGCSNREVRDAVSMLRTIGVPICSSNKGYWFAADDAEIRQTMAYLRHWIKGMKVALDGLAKCLTDGKDDDEEIVDLEVD